MLGLSLLFSISCKDKGQPKHRIIFDTDANNELDDQHALAYILSNGDVFDLEGVTVNATNNGSNIDQHYAEALRILQLYNADKTIPLFKGADKNFTDIENDLDSAHYDGDAGVQFLLDQANQLGKDSLIIIAVGKLTNIALAIKKDPEFVKKAKIVWLGSNYPEQGEYNQQNDTIAMNFVLASQIPFEMVTVRYGKPSGTDAVKAYQSEIKEKMKGLGPKAELPISGRHGGSFDHFGDYSISLFEYIHYGDEKKSRPLFDMVAAAIVKNPSWGQKREIPAPVLRNNQWVEQPENSRKITLWENFDKDAIMKDYYGRMEHYQLIKPK